MRIFITGINGFLGRYLAEKAISQNYTVTGLDISETCLVEGVEKYYCGSVLDKEIIASAVNTADAVVHLAALTAHSDIVDHKFKTLEINFLGTKNILDAYSSSPTAKKFIYTSTGKVYGTIQYLPIDEKHPPEPMNILGKSKYITERLIDFYDNGSKNLVVLRIFNVFGEKQKNNFLIPTILSQLQNSSSQSGKMEITLGDITAKRDYIYIDDVVNSIILSIEKELPNTFEIFNIGSGIPRNAEEIVNQMSKANDKPINITVNNSLLRNDEMDIEYGSYEKAEKLLGWTPQTDLFDWISTSVRF